MNLENPRYINILLLGETGTGKSTFINAVVNYFSFSDLKEAEKNFIVPIPCRFEIQDKNKYYHNIKATSRREQLKQVNIGQSVTRYVKSYIFRFGNIKIRLIDTPGIGDTRGPQQDKENCEQILSYIAELDVLHGICCLFPSSISVISVLFEYCLNEILSRLEKSAVDNLIFIFTKTRADNYTPGDTHGVLKRLIATIQGRSSGVKIPFENNIFSFENDSFRYLAASKKNVEFDNESKRNFKVSWDISRKEFWRLLNYIIGDNTHPGLKPHQIKDLVSINEARRVILNLSQPLADVSQLILDNINILERYQRNLRLENQSLDDLRKKLNMPVINLEASVLKEPVTVCTSAKCVEVYNVQSVKKYHYKQKCHNPCYLKGVPKEIIGSHLLLDCLAMNKIKKVCKQCGCHFTLHMHIYYETRTVDDTVIDDNVQLVVENKEQMLEEIKLMISNVEKRKMEFEKEREDIVQIMAIFAHFLQHHAISPINDTFERYIVHLINRETQLGEVANESYIVQLTGLLNQYIHAKEVFDLTLKESPEGGKINITAQTVMENVEKLYSLKYMGPKIKELMESQTVAYKKEHRRKDYVHRHTISNDQAKGITQMLVSVWDDFKKSFSSGSNAKSENVTQDGTAHSSRVIKAEKSQKKESSYVENVSQQPEVATAENSDRTKTPDNLKKSEVVEDVGHPTQGPPSYESIYGNLSGSSNVNTVQTSDFCNDSLSSDDEGDPCSSDMEPDDMTEKPRSHHIPPNTVYINFLIVFMLIFLKYIFDKYFFN